VGNAGARLLIADEEFAAIAGGDSLVVLLHEAAQSSRASSLRPRRDARVRGSSQTKRPDADDVHVGDDGPQKA